MSCQSAMAARASATALTTAKFTLLVALTMMTFAVLRLDNFAIPTAPIPMPKPLARLFAEPDPKPSAFDQEAAMSGKDLLDRWAPYVTEASQRFGVPQAWIRAVISQESGGRTVTQGDIPITSDAGAQGLMQVMPDTYAQMRAQYALGTNAWNPRDNIVAGTAYLSWLHKRYGFPKMFAAYNDGPGNFDRYVTGKRDLPAETVAYLADLSAALGAPRHRHMRA